MIERPKLVDIKKALQHSTHEELLAICIQLAKYKVENKELLHYVLFEAENENLFVEKLKWMLDKEFASINTSSYYWMRKSIRKQHKQLRKYIKFTKKKTIEIELLLYFLMKINEIQPSIFNDKRLTSLYKRTLIFVDNKIATVHEDLQYDYKAMLEQL